MEQILNKRYFDLFIKSVLFLTFFSLISCGSSPISNFAHYTHFSPLIDGKIDTLWYKFPDIKLNNFNLGSENIKNSNDLSVIYKIAWDTSFLYLLISVNDDKKFDVCMFKNTIDIPKGYNCDCIELCFDAKNKKINKVGSFNLQDGNSRFEFVYNRKGITGDYISNKGILFAQSDSPNGYIFEIAIPFKTISIQAKSEYTFGFELCVYDNDDSPNLPFYNFDRRKATSWSQKQGAEAWRNRGLLGNITLSENKKLN